MKVVLSLRVECFSPALKPIAYTLQQHVQLFKVVIDEIAHNKILWHNVSLMHRTTSTL